MSEKSANKVLRRYVVGDEADVSNKAKCVDLEWRLDVITNHRNINSVIQPKYVLGLSVGDITRADEKGSKQMGDNVIQVDLNTLRTTEYFEMDVPMLNKTISSLEQALKELRRSKIRNFQQGQPNVNN